MAKKVGNTYFFTGKGKSSGGGGGGGDATDAIKYTEQTLNESQQMQARKNQGLYYSEGGGEDITLAWDGDTTGLETIGGLYKVSENAPLASEVKSVSLIQNGVEQTYEVGVSPAQIVEVEGGYAIGSLVCLVITEDEVSVQGTTYTKGIWFVYGNENNRTSQLVYGQTETIHHIEPKYIKDMYYEEEVGGESIIHQIPSKYIPSSGNDIVDFAIEGTVWDYPEVRRGGAYMDIYNGLFDFTIRYTLPAPEAGAMRFCNLHHYKVSGDAVISFFVDDYHLQIDATEATPGDTALYMLDFYFYDTIDDERTGKEYHFGFPIFFEIAQGE